MIIMHKSPNCFHIFGVWAHGRSPIPLIVIQWCSASHCHSNTSHDSHDSLLHCQTLEQSCQKSQLQIYRVWRRVWCSLSALVCNSWWNHKCGYAHGHKNSHSTAHDRHTAWKHAHHHTAICWLAIKVISERFDTTSYISLLTRKDTSFLTYLEIFRDYKIDRHTVILCSNYLTKHFQPAMLFVTTTTTTSSTTTMTTTTTSTSTKPFFQTRDRFNWVAQKTEGTVFIPVSFSTKCECEASERHHQSEWPYQQGAQWLQDVPVC